MMAVLQFVSVVVGWATFATVVAAFLMRDQWLIPDPTMMATGCFIAAVFLRAGGAL